MPRAGFEYVISEMVLRADEAQPLCKDFGQIAPESYNVNTTYCSIQKYYRAFLSMLFNNISMTFKETQDVRVSLK